MKVKQIKNKGVLLVLWIIAMIFLNSVIGLYTTKKSQVETTSEYYQEINEQPLSSWYNTPYDPENAETPDLPEFYNFMDGPIPRYGIFLESHYGTHDWIADAALRLLINENEQGPLDWNWLLNDGVINNLLWQDDYADLNNKHYAVRSYILFLFATQMPDMDPDDANVPP